MWLNYTDREVESFHPICETILNNALDRLNLTNSYRVEHHRTVGSLEMDFVISNIRTSKILCVIEVKRTIEAVLSTRYQLQAMGYVRELRPAEKEKDYYILTNLESVAFFKYSSSRSNVIDQLLSPGIITIRRFSDSAKSEFIDELSKYFAGLIKRIINDDAEYFKSFRHFIAEVSDVRDQIISDNKLWHTKFAALAYEYIRGSLVSSGRNQLADIRRFNSDINRICREALRINFKGIYGLNEEDYSPLPQIPSETLNELYNLGSSYLDADAISDILFNLIAKCSPYPGAVPTDIELAKALAVIATSFCNNLREDESVLDPAAGSGNLLSVIPMFFPSIKPKQLKANDINKYLLQLLSLRLGLKFPRIVSNNDSPNILANNIADIPQSFFENVKLIVLNPPYLSHTSNVSNDYKSGIIRRIRSITGSNATTSSFKSPLESVFIELISLLAKDETTIACIVPLSHIYGMGESDVLFREMLLERFGLCCIFHYPQENIFKSVTQNTCVLVGKIGVASDEIIYINSLDTLSDIDFDSLKLALTDLSFTAANGIEKSIFSRQNLLDSCLSGWKILDSVASSAFTFLSDILASSEKFQSMKDSEDLSNSYRGKVGNFGGNDLLFPKVGGDFFNSVESLILPHLQCGVRTIQTLDSPYLSDSRTRFLDVSQMTDTDIAYIARIYKSRYEPATRRQIKSTKSISDYIDLLKTGARCGIPAGSILLARDCRRSGRAYLAETKTFASTNVYIFELNDTRKGRFYHSWFCSVFYQLNCELSSKNHAGARKMDAAEFASTFVPNFAEFSESEIESICSCQVDSFITLNNPSIRSCDIIWAKVISPSDWEEILCETTRYLGLLASDRES